jgi:transposase
MQKHQRRFGAMTQELQELAEWLRQFGVTQVAMESSGVYWKPVWNILEGQAQRPYHNPVSWLAALDGRGPECCVR